MTCKDFKNAIAYYRVSTKKQAYGRNSKQDKATIKEAEVIGLGLEAQEMSVKAYADKNCLELIQEFQEVETGTKKKKRPVIAQALAAAKSTGAVLLIAKLDRLARNVHFISGLMESGVDFVAVDMPTVTPLTLHVLAAVAEQEAVMISQRTKAALGALKARGVQLGTPENLTPEAQLESARVNAAAAIDAYKKVLGYVKLLRKDGMTFDAIAKQLNDEGHTTRQGKPFKAMTVKRMLDRGNGS